ncbi:hemicentin-1-like [Gigantopelta aegis]|uniref:hemicentin-1-like n=1 Tax=Gigantopelta aegis TaxID=1735272 RepID=UPI001B88BC35|nr:hemicentin-1-like [Gigantopelta aegis]
MGWLSAACYVVCFVQVLAGLDVTIFPKVNPVWVLEGTPISLTCQVKADKDVMPKWFKHYIPLNDYGFEISRSVNTDPVTGIVESNVTATRMDAQIDAYGVYLCQANVKEKMKNVHVFSVFLQNSNITVGEDVTIICDPQLSLEQLNVKWSKGGRPVREIPGLKERLKLSQNNYTLTIKNAMANDSGEYQCNIVFLAGTQSEQSFPQTVKMFGKPFFSDRNISKPEIEVTKNATVNIYCPVHGYPTPDVTWLKGDDILEPNDKIIINDHKGELTSSHLQIIDAQEDDIGHYMCNAENSLGRTFKKFQIKMDGISGASRVSYILGHVIVFSVTMFLCFL